MGLSFQTACVEGFTMGRVWKVWQNVPTFPLPTVGVQPAYLSEETVTQCSAGEDKTHGKHTIMLDDYSSWTYVCAVKNTDRDFPILLGTACLMCQISKRMLQLLWKAVLGADAQITFRNVQSIWRTWLNSPRLVRRCNDTQISIVLNLLQAY